MTANQRLIIRDYLMRRRWYFIAGFVINLIGMTGCWWVGKPFMLGIYGGSALILAFELNGNATTRTMLSLPVTAHQLARCWRFVGLEFPVVLFLIPLLLGTAIGAARKAPYLTLEFFLLIVIAQTLLLGILYCALTGVPVPGLPNTVTTIWQRAQNIFFGLLWVISIPGGIFLSNAIPRHFADLDRGQIIAGILLAVGSAVGWLRADVLVRNRAARPGSGNPKVAILQPARSARAWKRCGAMPYLCLRFGTITLLTLLAMLLFYRFTLGWLTSGPTRGNNHSHSQIGMFVMLATFISFSQLLSQLRVLRTLPLRTSTLTHWLLLWPFALAMVLGLLAQWVSLLLDGAPVDWQLFGQSVFGAGLLTILLPLTLRFGHRLWTITPVMMIAAFMSSMAPLVWGGFVKNHWPWSLAGMITVLLVVWWSTRRLLDTAHPWRARAMKGLAAGRRM
jgi:hypothetical protein